MHVDHSLTNAAPASRRNRVTAQDQRGVSKERLKRLLGMSRTDHPEEPALAVKLEARDIRLEYEQPRTNLRLTALDGINLAIMDGEFVAIVGPSECGAQFLDLTRGPEVGTYGGSRSSTRQQRVG
jgi:ABC-type transport system involved in cytochrome bd biosynthesis fused ATPase/permease subunit